MKKSKLSFIIKLFFIIVFHVGIYLISELFFLFDTLSIKYQFTSSLIQIIFIYLVFRFLIKPYNITELSKKIGIIIILFFLILNIESIDLGVRLYDNGFVPWWSMAEQKIYGYPFIFLRIYEGSLQNLDYKIGNHLIHYNHLFLNIYCLIFILAIQNKYSDKILQKLKEFMYS